jgi:hypothetical protein
MGMTTSTSPLRSRAHAALHALRETFSHWRQSSHDHGLDARLRGHDEVSRGPDGMPGRRHQTRWGCVCSRPVRGYTQRGQAMTEYIVVVAAGIILLVVVAAGSSSSPVQLMIVALKNFWTNYSYLISLP